MRHLIFEKSFDDAVAAIGGYEIVDEVLDVIIDALYHNPYGFPHIENDWVRLHYAVTRRLTIGEREILALVFVFVILENNDVSLRHVEEYEGY